MERSSKELRLAQHKAEAQLDLMGDMLRGVSIWQHRIDFELGLMAEIIFTESTTEERTHMPALARAAGATVQMGGRRSQILGPVAAAPLGMHRR